jgi:hypothetical protein
VYSQADLLGRDKHMIKVTYGIGDSRAEVELFVNKAVHQRGDEAHTCLVWQPPAVNTVYQCDVIYAGQLRDFVLRQNA